MKFKFAVIALAAAICSFAACKKSSNTHVPINYQLILRPDSTTGQDSYVAKLDNDPADGNTNLNAAHELCLARWTQSWYHNDSATFRGYIRFDSLAKVPAKAAVTSAILYLYGEGTDSSASFPFGDSYPGSSSDLNGGLIQLVTGGTWDQKTINFNNAPAATASGQDTIPPSNQAWNYNVAVDVTNLVKQQIANPSTNYGFLLKLQVEQLYRAMEFATCENSDSLERPKLVVSYSY